MTDESATTRYAYDAVGNLVSVTDSKGFTTSYTYDSTGRIKEVEVTGKTTRYTYDQAGNRLSMEENTVDILCDLLEVPWHIKHEDIAHILYLSKDPRSVDSLFKTAIIKHEYLEYNDSHELARKCIYALGNIGTKESLEKLKLLTQIEDVVIREYAIKYLQRNI